MRVQYKLYITLTMKLLLYITLCNSFQQ